MRDQSENRPGLWSTCGPPGGSSLCWLIIQSKSSSEFCESWQVSSHWFSSMLKLQEPGSLRMWSRRVGWRRRVTHSIWMYLSQKRTSLPLFPGTSSFYSPQSNSSDPSAQSALLSHIRRDSMQWPLWHLKSVSAGQLTGSTTSTTQRDKQMWESIRYSIFITK